MDEKIEPKIDLLLPIDKSQIYDVLSRTVEDFAEATTGTRELHTNVHGITNFELVSRLYPLFLYVTGKGKAKCKLKASEFTVLDIGSGNVGQSKEFEYDNWIGTRNGGSASFRPWLARILNYIGVRIIAVDYGTLRGESYEHYSKDILTQGSLDVIPDNSVDIIHSRLLFSSPQLERTIEEHLRWDDAFIQNYSETQRNIEKNENPARGNIGSVLLARMLEPQIERVLTKDGVYITETWPLERGVLSITRGEDGITYLFPENSPKSI